MNVDISLPPMFKQLAGISVPVQVNGRTVGECLRKTADRYPILKTQFFNQDGQIKPGLTVFLNGESAYPRELDKPVRDGDTIHISQTILGG